jgi:hypothetical protein
MRVKTNGHLRGADPGLRAVSRDALDVLRRGPRPLPGRELSGLAGLTATQLKQGRGPRPQANESHRACRGLAATRWWSARTVAGGQPGLQGLDCHSTRAKACVWSIRKISMAVQEASWVLPCPKYGPASSRYPLRIAVAECIRVTVHAWRRGCSRCRHLCIRGSSYRTASGCTLGARCAHEAVGTSGVRNIGALLGGLLTGGQP